jgi:glucose-6-phosphate dehydrogenase assembly protein OpcA
MATATSDDFLSGQGVPVELHDVETELTRLWGPAAEQIGGPDLENPHVTRVALANLVVMRRSADAARLQTVLGTVSARYPSRTIVLCRSDEPGRAIRAEISALCHLPAPSLPQVCSERIVLRSGPEGVALIPGAVRPLLEAELPFVLWWTEDPRTDEPLFRDLADECTRLILDLPDPGADPSAVRLGLDPAICPHSRDTAWFGLAGWRELVAQFFDPPCHHETLDRLDTVRIEALASTRQAPPRLAVWLAAWLAGQLGWTPIDHPERSEGRLSAQFRGPSGAVRVEIVTRASPSQDLAQLCSTTLTTRGSDDSDSDSDTGPETFRLIRVSDASPEVRLEIDSTAYCTLPRSVLAPELDAARRVSAALESSRNDPPFQKALPHALWLLGV